ncbi:MAG: AGE family epimerase/isomerase [Gemmatimonadota bacterium]|nr:AGE family epimerase/isomerase [Gemmatimonadota bacterium]
MTESSYRGILLPERPTHIDVGSVLPDYRAMLLAVMAAIADRYERAPDYPFIDTKLDLITGEDFPPDDPVRGPNAVYGWIQGRGLESLAGHCRWMRRHHLAPELRQRLEPVAAGVLEALLAIRARNAGRLSFFMTADGDPFTLDDEGGIQAMKLTEESSYGFSDLFSAKGMVAAARYLEKGDAEAEAMDYCRRVDDAINEGRFVTDQVSLDPGNPAGPRHGRHPHGAYMIQIGAAALLAEHRAPCSVEMGLRLIRHELRTYVNLNGRVPRLREYDFWEAVDDDGAPCEDDGKILSDPGHVLEFIGLTLKFTSTVRENALADTGQRKEIAEVEALMPALLSHTFAAGFQPGPGGICKGFDLVSRAPANTDMPWWNLPETLRAAAYCFSIARTAGQRQDALDIFSACHNALTRHFVRPDLHLMAYQTRDESGRVAPVIPATADADPGYHTGLSIIDVLEIFENM